MNDLWSFFCPDWYSGTDPGLATRH